MGFNKLQPFSKRLNNKNDQNNEGKDEASPKKVVLLLLFHTVPI